MNIIGNRDPWEIMHRAQWHMVEQMYFMVSIGKEFGWRPGMYDMHNGLYEAHRLLINCCEEIRFAKKVA